LVPTSRNRGGTRSSGNESGLQTST
jgi:hypothetical protein